MQKIEAATAHVLSLLDPITQPREGKTEHVISGLARNDIRWLTVKVWKQFFDMSQRELDLAVLLAAGTILDKPPFPIDTLIEHFQIDEENKTIERFDTEPVHEWLNETQDSPDLSRPQRLRNLAEGAIMATLLYHLLRREEVYL